jgi:hypothetical protein
MELSKYKSSPAQYGVCRTFVFAVGEMRRANRKDGVTVFPVESG